MICSISVFSASSHVTCFTRVRETIFTFSVKTQYQKALESEIGADEFMSDIDGMDAFINEEVPSQEGGGVWEEPYQ